MAGLKMITSSEEDSKTTASYSSISKTDAAERIAVMQDQETTSYKSHDYIACDTTSSPSSCAGPHQEPHRGRVDRECREKMCQWCYQVTDFCKFRREAVAISMSYLDRFLSSSSPRAQKALYSKKEYQLASMTCLYLAVKLFEPMVIDASLLAAISQGCYAEKDIIDMEEDILHALKWRMNGPIVHDFISHIMVFLPKSAYSHAQHDVTTILSDFSRYQAEISVCDYDLSLMNNGDIALAALLNSIEGIDEKVFPARSRFEFFLCISDETGLNPFSYDVNVARSRLLKLFRKNSGYELPQVANLTPVVDCSKTKKKKEFTIPTMKMKRLNSTGSTSPVSVTHQFERRDSRAKCA
ncbi:hypothetical protein ACHAWC_011405 [Mediolabrus comicus]